MFLFVLLIIVFIVIGIIIIADGVRLGIGMKVTARIVDTETGRTLHAGHGDSIGSAVTDGFAKMYNSLSSSSKIDTIRTKPDVMIRTLNENKSRMTKHDIEQCYSYINRTKSMLSQKEAEINRTNQERMEAEQAKKREQQEKQAAIKQRQKERAHEIAQRKAQAEKERIEREKTLPEHKRFIAEQRRLMSDALRYKVLSRDSFRCQICGATQADGIKLHVDHIMPVSKGGKTELSNLRTLCERCNMGKRDMIETVSVPMTKPTTAGKSFSSIEDFLEYIKCNNLEYVDKLHCGGCLWIRSTSDVDPLISSITISGKKLIKANATSHFNGNPGWYLKNL